MKKQSRILIIVNLVILLGYFNWSVFKKEQTLEEGQLVLLELAPVDPRSLMQGDYMRLNYAEVGKDSIVENSPERGYAVLRIGSNHVGQIIRLQKSAKPLHENEFIIKYKTANGRVSLGAESFFFEEGQDSIYDQALYGGLKVDDKGESILIGLYNDRLQLIQP